MHAVARACGLEVGYNNKARCPFHDDRRPSLQIYPDGYHCFVCGAHGDAIDLVQGIRGCSKREAAEAVARISGGELYVIDSGAVIQRQTERERCSRLYDIALDAYRAAEREVCRYNAQICDLSPFSAAWVFVWGKLNEWLWRLNKAELRLIEAEGDLDDARNKS